MIADMTGSGAGFYDILRATFGQVVGIRFGSGATSLRMFYDSAVVAEEHYANIDTQMWFETARMMEIGHLYIGRGVDANTLIEELTTRSYELIGRGRSRVDSKDEQKKILGRSPDEADATVMLAHLFCMRSERKSVFGPEPDPRSQKAREWKAVPNILNELTKPSRKFSAS
jgi:hypothetical protein